MIQARDESDIREAVAQAGGEGRTLEIRGRGTRGRMGGPVHADEVLDVSGLDGVVLYEPNELVLTVRPGASVAEVRALLAAERQHLAFEPPDFGVLWGAAPEAGTMGGLVSVGLGGPRRPFAGGPRDHLLGFKAVNGFAEAFAGGGRVVKNVTGFDLPKLMAGAYGTLAVLTELTLKVVPAPETSTTLVLAGLEEAEGLAVLRRAGASAVEPTACAYLPENLAETPDGRSATALRIEGPRAVAQAAVDRLRRDLDVGGVPAEVLPEDESRRFWRGIGGAEPLAAEAGSIWRISAPATCAVAVADALRGLGAERVLFDWSGGLVWAALPDAAFAGGDRLRPALASIAPDAHATLVRGVDGLADRIPALQPPSPGVAALSARLKARFDPKGVFNPGRLA